MLAFSFVFIMFESPTINLGPHGVVPGFFFLFLGFFCLVFTGPMLSYSCLHRWYFATSLGTTTFCRVFLLFLVWCNGSPFTPDSPGTG